MPKSDFEVIKFLGKGSFGSVSLVKRITDGKQYALKEMDVAHMNMRDRLDQLNEIRVMASIYHPNIVSYFETFVEGGKLYIVTEYANGGDLDKFIEKHKKSRTKISENVVWSVLV